MGSALDPTDTGAAIIPHYVNLAGVSMTNSPSMSGINIVMPSTYVGSGDIYAAEFTGDGGTVLMCADGFVFAVPDDEVLNSDSGVESVNAVVVDVRGYAMSEYTLLTCLLAVNVDSVGIVAGVHIRDPTTLE